VELALRGRIALEKTGLRRRSLVNRKVICTSETPTGDSLLDEALKHIKDTKPLETTQTWIDYLSGIYVDVLSFYFFYSIFGTELCLRPNLIYEEICGILQWFYIKLLTHNMLSSCDT